MGDELGKVRKAAATQGWRVVEVTKGWMMYPPDPAKTPVLVQQIRVGPACDPQHDRPDAPAWVPLATDEGEEQMTEWSVAFEAAGPTDDTALAEDQLWPLLEALSAHSPAVGGGGPRYDAQFNVTASDAGAAMTQALRIWRRAVGAAGLPPWPIVHVEILTAAEHERVLTEPQPELVGVSEIAAILGTTRNRAWQVTKKIDFPEPLAELAGGPVWALPMVTRFLEEWPRRRGPVPGVARAQVDQPRRLEAGDLDSTEPHVCPGAHPRRPGGEGTATRQGGGNPMPKKSPVHTVPHGDGWANRREGAERVSKTFGTKAEAQAAGRDTAKRDSTEHVIHKKDGSIGEKNSYGNDSYPPRG